MLPDADIYVADTFGTTTVPATDKLDNVPTVVMFGCNAEAADKRPVILPLTLTLPALNDVGVLKLVKLLPSP